MVRQSRIEYRWIILGVGFLILFLGGGRLYIIGLVLKPMSEDLGMSRSALSLVVTASSLTSAAALLIFGRLLDRYSLRLIMAFAAVLSAFGYIFMGLVVEPWQAFLVYSVVIALAGPGISLLSIGVMISRWFDRRHGIVMAATQSGGYLGQLVTLGLLATFLGALGWRNAFSLVGVVYLALVPGLILFMVRSPAALKASPAQSATAPRAGMFDVVRGLGGNRELWLLVLVYAICGFQDTFVSTHIVAFALDEHMSEMVAGNLLAVMGIMGLLGVLTAGALADGRGAVSASLLCFVIRIGVFALILTSKAPLAIGAFGLLYGYTFPITAPIIVVFVRKIYGVTNLGVLSAFLLLVHQVLGGLGAYVGALFFDHTQSYDGAFALMLVLSVIAAVASVLIRERPAAPAGKPSVAQA